MSSIPAPVCADNRNSLTVVPCDCSPALTKFSSPTYWDSPSLFVIVTATGLSLMQSSCCTYEKSSTLPEIKLLSVPSTTKIIPSAGSSYTLSMSVSGYSVIYNCERLYVISSALSPIVGTVFMNTRSFIRYSSAVFPLPSSPTIAILYFYERQVPIKVEVIDG